MALSLRVVLASLVCAAMPTPAMAQDESLTDVERWTSNVRLAVDLCVELTESHLLETPSPGEIESQFSSLGVFEWLDEGLPHNPVLGSSRQGRLTMNFGGASIIDYETSSCWVVLAGLDDSRGAYSHLVSYFTKELGYAAAPWDEQENPEVSQKSALIKDASFSDGVSVWLNLNHFPDPTSETPQQLRLSVTLINRDGALAVPLASSN